MSDQPVNPEKRAFWPKYRAGPVEYWLGAAFTEFVNGFISGMGAGSVVGVSGGVTTASTGLGAGEPWWWHALVAVAGLILTGAGNGLKRLIVWHDGNEFPNPWPKPTGNTPQPFKTTQ